MPNYKKNHFPGDVNPFFSSSDHAYDRMMNNINNSVESNILSPFQRIRFKGIVLSGYDKGNITAEKTAHTANDGELVDFGDGIVRWKFRFVIEESLYDTDVGVAFTAAYGRSPLETGISDAERAYRISRMPVAYTESEHTNYTSVFFGAVISLVQRHGVFFVVSYGGENIFSGKPSPWANHLNGGTGGDPFSGKDVKGYKPAGENYDASVMSLAGDAWWIEILETIIAEKRGHASKTCVSGKTYRDFCRTDGGNIGIAHWAGGSIRSLIDEMVNFYGKDEIESWFGKKVSYIKKHVRGCTQASKRLGKYHPDYPKNAKEGVLYQRCKDNLEWYRKGVTRFVAEYNDPATTTAPKKMAGKSAKERQAAMIKVQQTCYYNTKVKRAIEEMTRCGWPFNKRNLSIALGIINSNGSIGRGKTRWQGDPESLADKYVLTHDHPKHAGGRMALIQKTYPIKKPAKRSSFTPSVYPKTP